MASLLIYIILGFLKTKKIDLRLYCPLFSYGSLKNRRLTSPLKAFNWKKNQFFKTYIFYRKFD